MQRVNPKIWQKEVKPLNGAFRGSGDLINQINIKEVRNLSSYWRTELTRGSSNYLKNT